MKSLKNRVLENFSGSWGGMIDAEQAKIWMNTVYKHPKYKHKLDGTKPSSWSVDDFANWMLDSQLNSNGVYTKDKSNPFISKVLKLSDGFDLVGNILDNDGFFKMNSLNKEFNKYETAKSSMYDIFNQMKVLVNR